MFSFLKKRLLYRFIIVYLQDDSVFVHIYDIKNTKVLNSDTVHFELEKKNEFTEEIIDFINKKQDEILRSYVVTLVNSLGQGIIPTCNENRFKDFHIDKKYIYYICIDNLFTNYVTKADIKWVQKIFAPVGIDLIFSPFIVLKKLIENYRIQNDDVILFILYHNLYATLIVYKDGKYIYGNFFNILDEKSPLYTDYENSDEDEIEDESFEIDEILDDNFDEITSFELDDVNSTSMQNINNYKIMVDLVQENRGFAYQLSNSLKEFYSNKIYDSNFVDKIVIFSEDSIDINLIEYIENELFLSVDTEMIEMDEVVLNLSKEELF